MVEQKVGYGAMGNAAIGELAAKGKEALKVQSGRQNLPILRRSRETLDSES